MKETNRTHSLIYFVKESNNYIITTPQLWADANPHHFSMPPRNVQIIKYLKDNFGFAEIPRNRKTLVLHNSAPNIPIGKSGKSFYKSSTQ